MKIALLVVPFIRAREVYLVRRRERTRTAVGVWVPYVFGARRQTPYWSISMPLVCELECVWCPQRPYWSIPMPPISGWLRTLAVASDASQGRSKRHISGVLQTRCRSRPGRKVDSGSSVSGLRAFELAPCAGRC